MTQYRPHIYVLPEDDADREIANGFLLNASLDARCIQIMRPSGGWSRVVDDFNKDYAEKVNKNSLCHVVLLVDFDNKTAEDLTERYSTVKRGLQEHPEERVFVLGVWSEPEKLRKALKKSTEAIGFLLASECEEGTSDLWGHELLRHNREELMRMSSVLRPILFPTTE